MYLIGLTGGIAAGKSTVSAMLKEYGATIIDADQCAREIVEPHTAAWQAIVDYLGEKILLPDQKINRKALGTLVFKDHELRKWLESVTHPAIMRAMKEKIEAAKKNGVSIAVLDAPLLIEVGWQNMVNEVWLVYVNEATQLARLMTRNKLTEQEAFNRIHSQMSLQEKKKYAQVFIDNSGTLEQTAVFVRVAWNRAGQKAH